MMEDAVRARVLDQVTALGTRVYPLQLPQSPTLPAATYGRVSMGSPDQTFDGPSGMRGPRIRVDVWDDTYGGARTVATAIRTALDGYRGPAGAEEIAGSFEVLEQSLYEDDTKLHRVMLEFQVWGEE